MVSNISKFAALLEAALVCELSALTLTSTYYINLSDTAHSEVDL